MKRTIGVMSIMILIALSLSGCGFNANKIGYEELCDMVYERVTERYMSEDSGYDFTDIEVYPLYNENEELTHFIVEFEPRGFVYVKVNRVATSENDLFAVDDQSKSNCPWQRYTINQDPSESFYTIETDKNGQIVDRYNSHYKEAHIQGERRYLLLVNITDPETGSNSRFPIPAVKRGDKWLNLISMEEFELSDDPILQAHMRLWFWY